MKFVRWTLFLFILLQARLAVAANSVIIQFDDDFSDALVAQLAEMTELVFRQISHYKSSNLHSTLLNPPKNNGAGSKLVIINWVTRSENQSSAPTGVFTAPVISPERKAANIIVNLVFDQLVRDSQGEVYPDKFIRTLAALSSQLFGPVEAYLNLSLQKMLTVDPEIMQKAETQGHQATQQLLKAVLADSKPSRPESIRQHLLEAILCEEQMIQNASQKACATLLPENSWLH